MQVAVTVDLDGEALWLNRDPENARLPVVMSQGAYGPRTGLPRLLSLFESHQIRATFFVPGWIAERYPTAVESIMAGHHEVAHHGYRHEWVTNLTADEEEQILRKGIDALVAATGKRPLGYRAPGWEVSERTLSLLTRYEFLYSSNFMDADDPYQHPNGLVELPVDWSLADTSYFLYSLRLPGTKLMGNDQALSTWFDAFSVLHGERRPLFLLTLHPEISGRPARVRVVQRLFDYIASHNAVEFATCADIVRGTAVSATSA